MSSTLSAQLHHHTNLCSVQKASVVISWSGPGRFIYADILRPISNDICIIGGPCRGSITVIGAPHGGLGTSSSLSHSLFAGLPNLTACPQFSLLRGWKASGITPIPPSHSVLYGQSLNWEGKLAEPIFSWLWMWSICHALFFGLCLAIKKNQGWQNSTTRFKVSHR